MQHLTQILLLLENRRFFLLSYNEQMLFYCWHFGLHETFNAKIMMNTVSMIIPNAGHECGFCHAYCILDATTTKREVLTDNGSAVALWLCHLAKCHHFDNMAKHPLLYTSTVTYRLCMYFTH